MRCCAPAQARDPAGRPAGKRGPAAHEHQGLQANPEVSVLLRTDMGIDSRMVASSRARPGCAVMNVVPSTVCGARHSGSEAPGTLTTGTGLAIALSLGSCARTFGHKDSREASALPVERTIGWGRRAPAKPLREVHTGGSDAGGAASWVCMGAALKQCRTPPQPLCL